MPLLQLTWHHHLCRYIRAQGCSCHPCEDMLSRHVRTSPPNSHHHVLLPPALSRSHQIPSILNKNLSPTPGVLVIPSDPVPPSLPHLIPPLPPFHPQFPITPQNSVFPTLLHQSQCHHPPNLHISTQILPSSSIFLSRQRFPITLPYLPQLPGLLTPTQHLLSPQCPSCPPDNLRHLLGVPYLLLQDLPSLEGARDRVDAHSRHSWRRWWQSWALSGVQSCWPPSGGHSCW